MEIIRTQKILHELWWTVLFAVMIEKAHFLEIKWVTEAQEWLFLRYMLLYYKWCFPITAKNTTHDSPCSIMLHDIPCICSIMLLDIPCIIMLHDSPCACSIMLLPHNYTKFTKNSQRTSPMTAFSKVGIWYIAMEFVLIHFIRIGWTIVIRSVSYCFFHRAMHKDIPVQYNQYNYEDVKYIIQYCLTIIFIGWKGSTFLHWRGHLTNMGYGVLVLALKKPHVG